MSSLATRFSKARNEIRQNRPLTSDEIHAVAPSIFALDKHDSRSERYTYIATGDVLTALQKEGFEPFMVCQGRARTEGRREHMKHMVRLRHASQIDSEEANEIILVNSHDGTSSYQMLGGLFRFACANGMIRGDQIADLRIPHKGDVLHRVIEGAYTVLDQFDEIAENVGSMKACILSDGAQDAFAKAALALRYDENEHKPIGSEQLLRPRRRADFGSDLWTTFNRVQENILRGGLSGRNANGKRTSTRAVGAIDQNLKLNRGLWVLADEMRKLVA
jgi:hypothetical protein